MYNWCWKIYLKGFMFVKEEMFGKLLVGLVEDFVIMEGKKIYVYFVLFR